MTTKARKKIRSALIVFHGSVLKQKTEYHRHSQANKHRDSKRLHRGPSGYTRRGKFRDMRDNGMVHYAEFDVGVGENGGTAAGTCNIGNRWRCVVSFTLQAYNPETGSLLPTLQKVEWISEPVWVQLMKITVSKH